MNAAVKFDHKFGGIAVEIDNVLFDDLLTAEVKPVDPVSPKHLPENALGRGHFAPQSLRERQLVRLNTLDAGYFTAVGHRWLPLPKNLTPNPFPLFVRGTWVT